jgi:hypothetical protein
LTYAPSCSRTRSLASSPPSAARISTITVSMCWHDSTMLTDQLLQRRQVAPLQETHTLRLIVSVAVAPPHIPGRPSPIPARLTRMLRPSAARRALDPQDARDEPRMVLLKLDPQAGGHDRHRLALDTARVALLAQRTGHTLRPPERRVADASRVDALAERRLRRCINCMREHLGVPYPTLESAKVTATVSAREHAARLDPLGRRRHPAASPCDTATMTRPQGEEKPSTHRA